MELSALVALGTVVAQTIQNIIKDGRTKTTAEEDAALSAAHARADEADADYDAADKK